MELRKNILIVSDPALYEDPSRVSERSSIWQALAMILQKQIGNTIKLIFLSSIESWEAYQKEDIVAAIFVHTNPTSLPKWLNTIPVIDYRSTDLGGSLAGTNYQKKSALATPQLIAWDIRAILDQQALLLES